MRAGEGLRIFYFISAGFRGHLVLTKLRNEKNAAGSPHIVNAARATSSSNDHGWREAHLL